MQYLDVDLEIGVGSGRDYPVAVLRSPAGEARALMRFPFDDLTLENYLLKLQNALVRSGGVRRKVLSPQEEAVQDFGQRLFDALLTNDLRSCYDVSRREAAQRGMGVRLRLRVLAPELAALPWEYLYDPRQADYLCLSRHTLLVRYLEVQQPIQPLLIEPPLRILAMIASPTDLDALDVEREQERMRRALADLQAKGVVEVTWLEGQTWRHLQRAMRGGPWHVFHFIGHGGFDTTADEGVLALANDDGKAHLLRATEVGRLLANHDALRLAILNACEGAKASQRDIFSSTAATLARRGIPAVLAMQEEITDHAAIECTRSFYEALSDGLPVDAAVSEARTAISVGVSNTLEWGTPVLYMRAPDGVLFDLAKPSARPQPAPAAPVIEAAPAAPTKTLEEWLDIGYAADKEGRYEDALAAYEQAIKLDPDDAERYSEQGQALLELERYEEALAAFQRSLELDPLDHTVHYYKGVALRGLKQPEAAMAAFERSIEIYSGWSRPYNDKGDLLREAGQFEAALAAYNQAIDIDADNPLYHNNKGLLLLGHKRRGEAVAAFNQALALDQNNTGAWRNLGIVLLEMGRLSEATEAFRRADEE
jgi:tetratricopeptide (TPR) repeat protein